MDIYYSPCSKMEKKWAFSTLFVQKMEKSAHFLLSLFKKWKKMDIFYSLCSKIFGAFNLAKFFWCFRTSTQLQLGSIWVWRSNVKVSRVTVYLSMFKGFFVHWVFNLVQFWFDDQLQKWIINFTRLQMQLKFWVFVLWTDLSKIRVWYSYQGMCISDSIRSII